MKVNHSCEISSQISLRVVLGDFSSIPVIFLARIEELVAYLVLCVQMFCVYLEVLSSELDFWLLMNKYLVLSWHVFHISHTGKSTHLPSV